jgi:type I restriction enzyme S subunit
LDKLVIVRNEVVKIDRRALYCYAEIGDINVFNGGVIFHELKGYKLPARRLAVAKNGDVLISTVRTYRKGIGFVNETGDNLVTTNAMLTLCGVTSIAPGVSLPYVYSFLRSDFFVEQVWSLLNRGVYPRMDTGALGKIVIPVSIDKRVCEYVSALTLAIAGKEKAIRVRSAEIHAQIENELAANQTGPAFEYSYPTHEDVRETSRFDTGLYCAGFRAFLHRIVNYRHGHTTLSEMGVQSRRGPNLAVSVIGKSIYSDQYKEGWYELIRPVNIGENGTLESREWLGSPKKLPTVNRGDLILGCEGFEKGRSIVLVDAPNNCTTNFHGTVLSSPGSDIWQMIFVRCFLDFMRTHGVIDWVGVGGSGGHMSPDYFDYLPFPCFPEETSKRIASLYHNEHDPLPELPSLSDFVSWHQTRNDDLGIWQLDKEMKALQQELASVQDSIIEGHAVVVPYI